MSLEYSLNKLKELYQRADEFGLSWPSVSTILNQIHSETCEISEAMEQENLVDEVKEEVADLLHAVFCLCFFKNYDIEILLEKSIEKFEHRFQYLKKVASTQGHDNLKNLNYAEKMEIWKTVKKIEKMK